MNWSPGDDFKPTKLHSLMYTQMSRDVILSLLRQGSNGEQILQILDSIANGVSDSGGSDSAAAPTLSEIQF